MLQAAYQAALTQQAAAAQQLLLQQQGSQYIPPAPNFGHGGYNEALAAQVAAQLSLTPGYFNNSNINAAAAAAAAAAVQNIMSGSLLLDCKQCQCNTGPHAGDVDSLGWQAIPEERRGLAPCAILSMPSHF